MSDRLDRLARDYAPALLAFLGQPGEPRLRSAYELGRLALADGVSLLDVVRVHHAVLSDVLTSSTRDEDVASVVAGAATFLIEVLASFEMAQGAFQEAVANERRAVSLGEDG
jgi:hypothetical protein